MIALLASVAIAAIIGFVVSGGIASEDDDRWLVFLTAVVVALTGLAIHMSMTGAT